VFPVFVRTICERPSAADTVISQALRDGGAMSGVAWRMRTQLFWTVRLWY